MFLALYGFLLEIVGFTRVKQVGTSSGTNTVWLPATPLKGVPSIRGCCHGALVETCWSRPQAVLRCGVSLLLAPSLKNC